MLKPPLTATCDWALPVSDTECGLPAPVSVNWIAALFVPAVVGLNATDTLQKLEAASVAPVQLSAVISNCFGFRPLSATVLMSMLALPVLRIRKFLLADVTPTFTNP